MMDKEFVKETVAHHLSKSLKKRLRFQVDYHGCNDATVWAWLDGWPHESSMIPGAAYSKRCKCMFWGSGALDIDPISIAEYISVTEDDMRGRKKKTA